MQNVQTDDLRLSGKHVPSLDGVHGVAILLVIWFHLVQMFPEFHAMLGPLVVRTATLGQTGVDLFFVLSGFLITGILLDTRQHPHYFRNFFARRTLRIFPLYFVALAILLQFDRQWVTELPARLEASQLWMWTYLSNIPPSYGPTSVRFVHFWSLAVEEQFYLVWPLVVWFAGHRYIRHVCLACVLLGPCCRWLFMELEFSPFYSVFCRVDALAAGGLLAALIRSNVAHRTILRILGSAMAISIAVCGSLFWLFSGAGVAWIQVAKHSIAAVIYCGLIAICLSPDESSRWVRMFSVAPLRFFGKYSYCLYIVHPICIAMVRESLGERAYKPIDLLFVSSAVIGGSLIVSQVTWRVIERPAFRLKKYFAYSLEPAKPTVHESQTAVA